MINIRNLSLALLCLVLLTNCECDHSEEITLVLQPNAEIGKDAIVWSSKPDSPHGISQDFQAVAWTWSALGLPSGARRGLIDFDLSSVPADAIITDAQLYLYHNESSGDFPSTQGHNQRDGSNESTLKRITSSWEESSVTWNNQPSTTQENQVYVKASDQPLEDYQINVTNLIKDMIKHPDSSHGFLYSLNNEDYYRAMIFASSDHSDNTLHPKLEIQYIVLK